MDLIRALQRMEKGEILASHPLVGGSEALRRKSESSDLAVTGAFEKIRSRKSIRVAPTQNSSVESSVPSPPPKQTINSPIAQKHYELLVKQPPSISSDGIHEYSKILGITSNKAKAESKQQSINASTALRDAQRFVPVSFLKQYNESLLELKRDSVEKFFAACSTLRRGNTRAALRQWRSITNDLTAILKNRAVIAIQKIIRGFIGNVRVRKLFIERDDKLRLQIFEANSLIITRMQRWIRRCLARIIRQKKAASLQASKHSAAVERAEKLAAQAAAADAADILRYGDHGVKLKKNLPHKDELSNNNPDTNISGETEPEINSAEYSNRQNIASIKIQSIARMRRAYVKTCKIRAHRHRLKMQRRLEDPIQARALYFEHHGAAIAIQEWAKQLPSSRLRADKHRQVIQNRIRNGRANLIQRVWRGNRVRKQLKVLKAIHARLLLRKQKASTLFQALFRRYRTRKRLTKNQLKVLGKYRQDQNRDHVIIKRRNSISFSHLHIKDVSYLELMSKAAIKIQRIWRKFCNNRKFELTVIMVQNPAVLRITRWLRGWLWRRRARKFAKVIQKPWKEKLKQLKKYKKAVIKIQSNYRRYRTAILVEQYTKLFFKSITCIQGWIRIRLAVRRRNHKILVKRVTFESKASGLSMYNKTIFFTIYDELWDYSKRKKAPGPSELHKLFAQHCTNGTLDSAKAQKILKDSGNLIGTKKNDIEIPDVELVFARVKSQGERKLDYLQFMEFLHEIAILKYISKRPLDVDVDEKTFKFCRKKGKPALVCKLIHDHIAKNLSYKNILKELGNANSVGRGNEKVLRSALVICRAAKHKAASLLMKRLKFEMHGNEKEAIIYKSRIIIQRFARAYLGRRFLLKLAQNMYVKCTDPDSKLPFWFNPRTGNSSWTKPKLLRDLDCGEAIRLPKDDEKFIVMCSECDNAPANQFCDECDKTMCNGCVKLLHRAAKNKDHTQIPLIMCVECDFQVPTRLCITCGDYYCDTCFQHVHRKGRLRLHTMRWLAVQCDVCTVRAAAWKRANPDNPFEIASVCTMCYKEHNDGEEPEKYKNGVMKTRYTGPAIEEYRRKRQEEAHKAKMDEENRQRVINVALERRERAVSSIQRVYRGHAIRVKLSSFVRQRKAFLALRVQEMPTRQSKFYKFRDFFGMAPSLMSDTPKETILKLYPKYLHKTVGDCIEYKWHIVTEHLEKIERRRKESLKHGQKFTIGAAFTAWIDLSSKRNAANRARSDVAYREKSHETLRKQYRNARSDPTATAAKKAKLQKLAHDELERLEIAKRKIREVDADLDEAEMRLETFTGPRGIQKLISRRRREGILMPFRFSLTTGCKYALVTPAPLPAEDSNGNIIDPLSKQALAMAAQNDLLASRWTRFLKYGDIIRLEGGAFFKVITGDLLLSAYDESNEVGSEKMDFSEIVHDDDSTIEQLDTENEVEAEVNDMDNQDINSPVFPCKKVLRKAEGWLFDDVVEDILPLEVSNMYIKLDRAWVLPSAKDVEVRKIPSKPLHTNIAFQASQLFHSSPPSQIAIKSVVLMLSKIAQGRHKWADLIDDDLPEAKAEAKTKALQMEALQNSILKYSREPLNLNNHGHTIRLISKFASYLGTKSFEGASALASTIYMLLKREKVDPFLVWDSSGDKRDIDIRLEDDLGSTKLVGTILMDLDAPCSVMRIYLQRNLRDELNALTGDSFLFFGDVEGNETVLEREDEEKNDSRVFIVETNSGLSVVYTVKIMRDKSAEVIEIPEFIPPAINEEEEES